MGAHAVVATFDGLHILKSHLGGTVDIKSVVPKVGGNKIPHHEVLTAAI